MRHQPGVSSIGRRKAFGEIPTRARRGWYGAALASEQPDRGGNDRGQRSVVHAISLGARTVRTLPSSRSPPSTVRTSFSNAAQANGA